MEQRKINEKMEDWGVILSMLPDGWRENSYNLGALLRNRKFNPETLLRTLLIHLAEGCSLRETSLRARIGNIVDVSDVALLKRLNASGEWFRWMALELKNALRAQSPAIVDGFNHRIRIIDGTTIQEPGATGTTWKIHYSIELSTLICDDVYVTTPKTGESFCLFPVQKGDLFMGDRCYGNRNGIRHVVDGGGSVIVRINLAGCPVEDENGNRFDILEHLRKLKMKEVGDWDVWLKFEDKRIKGRICAVKKGKVVAQRAKKKLLKKNSRKGHETRPETLESAEYIYVFTTLEREHDAYKILELYRGRWQIEMVFKRLKSILGMGHLRKEDPEGSRAWIHGKLFTAFLIETLIVYGESFSPWGYSLPLGVQ